MSEHSLVSSLWELRTLQYSPWKKLCDKDILRLPYIKQPDRFNGRGKKNYSSP